MASIEIDFVSDFVCAWCYIAKRNLDSAMALYQKTYPGGKHDKFVITWTPYYLNYNPSPHSVDKLELAEVRLADLGPEQRVALTRRMERAGLASGITFNWAGKLGPNPATRDAHRLVRLVGDAYDGETQRSLVEALFDAYNCRAQDIAEFHVLLEAAQRAGVDAGQASAWLRSDEAGNIVDREAERRQGTGVPVLVIQGRHRPEGVPDVMDLMELFTQVKESQTS